MEAGKPTHVAWLRNIKAMGLTTALIVFVAMGLTVSETLYAHGLSVVLPSLFPTPAPASSVGAPEPQHPAPNTGPASWVMTPPELAGHTLHWTQVSYSYAANSPDPANGQLVTGSIWERVGSDGIPGIVFARYTLGNGTLMQEVLQTPQGITALFGSNYTGETPSCLSPTQPIGTAGMRSMLPSFVDGSKLASQGFSHHVFTGALAAAPSAVDPLPGVAALHVYSGAGALQAWTEHTGTSGKVSEMTTLIVDSNGRVVEQDGQVTNSAGAIVNETRTDYGALQVYTSSDVPPSVMPTQPGGICNG